MDNLEKIAAFFQWMKEVTRQAIDGAYLQQAVYEIAPGLWSEAELRGWSMLVIDGDGNPLPYCHWLVQMLQHQPHQVVTWSLYGWSLWTKSHSEQARLIQASFFHPPDLLTAEEYFWRAGDQPGFTTLHQTPDNWQGDPKVLKLFPWFIAVIPAQKRAEFAEKHPILQGDFALYAELTKALAKPRSASPPPFLSELCQKLADWAIAQNDSASREIAGRAAESFVTLWPNCPAIQQQLSVLRGFPGFACSITLEFDMHYRTFACQLQGAITGSGTGQWNADCTLEEIREWNGLLGYLYEQPGQRLRSIFALLQLRRVLGKLEIFSIHDRRMADLGNFRALSAAVGKSSSHPDRKITNLSDLLDGLQEIIGLDRVFLDIRGDQNIIDLPVDMLTYGDSPLATRVHLNKSVTGFMSRQFYLGDEPQVLFLSVPQGGTIRGHIVEALGEPRLAETAQAIAQIYPVQRAPIYCDGGMIALASGEIKHYAIVHLLCHGFIKTSSSHHSPPYGILIADAQENLRFVSARALADFLKDVKPALVFLSSCVSAQTLGGSRFCRGLISELLPEIPCIVAFRWNVPANVAQNFAVNFYAALHEHKHPVVAMRTARERFYPRYEGSEESCDWIAPVLIYQG